jgi:hypothetical protein
MKTASTSDCVTWPEIRPGGAAALVGLLIFKTVTSNIGGVA